MTAMTGSPHPGPSVPADHASAHAGTGSWIFAIGPVRVVHGDIGTGPLDAPGAGLKPRRRAARRAARASGLMRTLFSLSRRPPRPAERPAMPAWQHKPLIGPARRAGEASIRFCIPPDRAVEAGPQLAV